MTRIMKEQVIRQDLYMGLIILKPALFPFFEKQNKWVIMSTDSAVRLPGFEFKLWLYDLE